MDDRVAVDLWTGTLDLPPDRIAGLHDLLTPDERARAAAFRTPQLQSRYIAGRGQLRELLSRYLGSPAAVFRFTYTEHGRPELSRPGEVAPLDFNVSHAGGTLAIALSRASRLGVDIEHIAPLPELHDIARQNFSTAELRELDGLPDRLQLQAFYACWTQKEAYVKAMGSGLMAPLTDFDVSVHPHRPPALHRVLGDPSAPARWSMLRFAPAPDTIGAIAVEAARVRLFEHSLPSA